MEHKLNGLLWGAFVGDAISLGAHWIYNPGKIKRKFDRITDYADPASEYHPNRKAGQFTHYGDQTMTLLRSMQATGNFDLNDFATRWTEMWKDYDGYIDGATKGTGKNFNAGKSPEESGSSSNDLAGASRIAPILFRQASGSDDEFIDAVSRQTAMTHNHPQVIETAEFFAHVVKSILSGASVADAIESAAMADYAQLPAREWIAKADELDGSEAVPALGKLGLTCHIDEAFPATIFILKKYPDDLESALIENTMAGGDSAARGMIIGFVLGASLGLESIPSRWLDGMAGREEIQKFVNSKGVSPPPHSKPAAPTGKFVFPNSVGHNLAARLEMPDGEPATYAIFAHCFTCSKDIAAASRVSRELAARGIAVLRFDFTGIGNSEGDFANTNFSSNVDDLVDAAKHLTTNHGAPTLLIGHSLGGAAVLAAAARIEGIEGVVTIGAPSDPGHVAHLFADHEETIESEGEAEVRLGQRTFTVKKQFLEDIRSQRLAEIVDGLKVSLLVMHSPVDQTVSIDHARHIYEAAKHPKSFVSLDPADHLLTQKADSEYVAEIVAAWASRLIRRSTE